MKKRVLALILAIVTMLSLVACGKDSGGAAGGENGGEGFLMVGDDCVLDNVDFSLLDKKLDPQEVYDNLTYTPQMFCGEYRISYWYEDDRDQRFAETQEFEKVKIGDEQKEISKMLMAIEMGNENTMMGLNNSEDYVWARIHFVQMFNGKPYLDTREASVEVEGNKVKFTILEEWGSDNEAKKVTYKFSDVVLEYEFEFSGRKLTLSRDGATVELLTGFNSDSEDYFFVDNYLSSGSKAVADIDYMTFRYLESEGGSDRYTIDFVDKKFEDNYESIMLLEENGLATITVVLPNKTESYQFVYFYCSNDGIILTDGKEVYYYNDTYADRWNENLGGYISEDQTGEIDSLSESQIEEIIEKKDNLVEDLVKAFESAGIEVTVDEKTGEFAMDSTILFAGDSAELSDKGKDFLNKFVKAYTSIIFSDEYKDFVEKTVVEGHTAPLSNSTYESGLPLSEQRANIVKDYCLSSETGVDTTELAKNLEAIGYSNSRPVTDENGEVDMEASRRVSFRFVINLG